jgi:hypothetical protein
VDIRSGEGWRLRVDPQRQPFSVLIGGRDWAAELTAPEAGRLRAAVAVLVRQLAATAPLLMPDETLELEHASEGLWMQLSGTPEQWALRFLIDDTACGAERSRGLEGAWDCAASPALAMTNPA